MKLLINKWTSPLRSFAFVSQWYDYKRLLDEVFVISGIIKVKVTVLSRSRRLIIHCFEENNDKRYIAAIAVYFQSLRT